MALNTAQFGAQAAALITAHKDGSLPDATFEDQFTTLVTSWGVSNPALAQAIADQTSAFNAIPSQLSTWLSGVADGGFHADGTPTTGPGDPLAGFYPLANVGGAISYVPSPAKNAASTAKGQKGDTGASPVLQGGTVATGAAGSSVQASIDNTNPLAPKLNLTVPQGAAPVLQGGTVTTGAPGTAVQAALDNTNPLAPKLNLTVPQGSQGNAGPPLPYILDSTSAADNAYITGLKDATGAVITALVDGLQVRTMLKYQLAAGATLQVNGLAKLPVVVRGGGALLGFELQTGVVYDFVLRNGAWEVQGHGDLFRGDGLDPDWVARTMREKVNERGLSLLDLVPRQYHNEIISGLSAGNDFAGYINNALTKVGAAGGTRRGLLMLPPGVCKLGSSIQAVAGTRLVGCKPPTVTTNGFGTQLQPLAGFSTSNPWMVDWAVATGFSLEDVRLYGFGLTNTGLGGVRLNAGGAAIRDVVIQNFSEQGIQEQSGALNTYYKEVVVLGCLKNYQTPGAQTQRRAQIEIIGPDAILDYVQAYGGQAGLITNDPTKLWNIGIWLQNSTAILHKCWVEQNDCGYWVDNIQSILEACNSERNFGPGYIIGGGKLSACRSEGDCIGNASVGGVLDAVQVIYGTGPLDIDVQVTPDANGQNAATNTTTYHRYGVGVYAGTDLTGQYNANYPSISDGSRSVGHAVAEFHPALVCRGEFRRQPLVGTDADLTMNRSSPEEVIYDVRLSAVRTLILPAVSGASIQLPSGKPIRIRRRNASGDYSLIVRNAAYKAIAIVPPHLRSTLELEWSSAAAEWIVRRHDYHDKEFLTFDQQGAICTGSISGTVLTVTSVAYGKIGLGAIAGTNITSGTQIVPGGTGTGGVGTYTVNTSQTAASAAVTQTSAGYYSFQGDRTSDLTTLPGYSVSTGMINGVANNAIYKIKRAPKNAFMLYAEFYSPPAPASGASARFLTLLSVSDGSDNNKAYINYNDSGSGQGTSGEVDYTGLGSKVSLSPTGLTLQPSTAYKVAMSVEEGGDVTVSINGGAATRSGNLQMLSLFNATNIGGNPTSYGPASFGAQGLKVKIVEGVFGPQDLVNWSAP